MQEKTKNDTTPTEEKSLFPPFQVGNKSRAYRLAKKILGPQARVWVHVQKEEGKPWYDLVQVGTESGGCKDVVSTGFDLEQALKPVVQRYLDGAQDYQTAKDRLGTVLSTMRSVGDVGDQSLRRFPEYLAELKRLQEARNNVLKKAMERGAEALAARPAGKTNELNRLLTAAQAAGQKVLVAGQ